MVSHARMCVSLRSVFAYSRDMLSNRLEDDSTVKTSKKDIKTIILSSKSIKSITLGANRSADNGAH